MTQSGPTIRYRLRSERFLSRLGALGCVVLLLSGVGLILATPEWFLVDPKRSRVSCEPDRVFTFERLRFSQNDRRALALYGLQQQRFSLSAFTLSPSHTVAFAASAPEPSVGLSASGAKILAHFCGEVLRGFRVDPILRFPYTPLNKVIYSVAWVVLVGFAGLLCGWWWRMLWYGPFPVLEHSDPRRDPVIRWVLGGSFLRAKIHGWYNHRRRFSLF